MLAEISPRSCNPAYDRAAMIAHNRQLAFRLAAGALVAATLGVALAAAPSHAAPPVEPRPATASRSVVTSFHFSNVPVRSALRLLAEEGGVNLIVSDAVQGTVSLHLEGVTWEQALDVVLRLKDLRQHVHGSTRTVSPAGG